MRRVFYLPDGPTDAASIAAALKPTLCPKDADVRVDEGTGIVAITTAGPWRGEETTRVDLDARAAALAPLNAIISAAPNKTVYESAVAARDAAERAWDANPVLVLTGRIVETGLGVTGWALVGNEEVGDKDAPPEVDPLVAAKLAHVDAATIDVSK